ncbi:hypothetical protein [Spiroplasma endosymbiont of Asaphidion curtum]
MRFFAILFTCTYKYNSAKLITLLICVKLPILKRNIRLLALLIY